MSINKITPWCENLQTNVKNIATNAGTRGSAAKYYTDTSMYYIFDSGKTNPSVAKIVIQDTLQKGGILAKLRFFNKFNSRKFNMERKEFDDTFQTLYPKTGDLRNKLINSGRFTLDKITKKASKFTKLTLG